ncbi:MAG: SRPBCC domain-containing protein [Solirubrobacterales bacterium]
MTITSVDTNYEDLSVTLIADFDAPIDRVWELWSDPRKLERWWGPPSFPATVEKHDLSPGGEVTYLMTGPDGEIHHGLWRITAVGSPASLEFDDVFANADGTPNTDLPVNTVTVRLTERGSGTRMEMRSKFKSREDLEKWLATGTLEGQRQAVGQMDVLLAA